MAENPTKETDEKSTIKEFVKEAGFRVDFRPVQDDPDEDRGRSEQDDPDEDRGRSEQVPYHKRLSQKEIAGLYRILSRKGFHRESVKKFFKNKKYDIPSKDELDALEEIRQDVQNKFCPDDKY
jgi:hypothetical protein